MQRRGVPQLPPERDTERPVDPKPLRDVEVLVEVRGAPEVPRKAVRGVPDEVRVER
jgi:hypothetical protein